MTTADKAAENFADKATILNQRHQIQMLELELETIKTVINKFYDRDGRSFRSDDKFSIFDLVKDYLRNIQTTDDAFRSKRIAEKKAKDAERIIACVDELKVSNRLAVSKCRILKKMIESLGYRVDLPSDRSSYQFNSRDDFERFMKRYAPKKKVEE
jgi:hypothetical protein